MFEKTSLLLKTLNDTDALARQIAPLCKVGDLIYLRGSLGMGKTAFARAFIRTLSLPDLEVPSPTFTLVQPYFEASPPIWHFDLYRLERPQDVYELGIDEAETSAITLIEWPERLGSLQSEEALTLTFTAGNMPEERIIFLSGPQEWIKNFKREPHHEHS